MAAHRTFLGLRVLLGGAAHAALPPPSAPPREQERGCVSEGLQPPRRSVPSTRGSEAGGAPAGHLLLGSLPRPAVPPAAPRSAGSPPL